MNLQTPISNFQIQVAQQLLDIDRVCTIRDVQDAACEYFEIPRPILLGVRRGNHLHHVRRVTIYVCSKLTRQPYAEIGRRFNSRDHSSIIHNVKKAGELLASGGSTAKDVNALVAKLGGFQ